MVHRPMETVAAAHIDITRRARTVGTSSCMNLNATPHRIIARAVLGFIETCEGRMLFSATLSTIHPINTEAPIHMAIQPALFETNMTWGIMWRWVNIMTQMIGGPSRV